MKDVILAILAMILSVALAALRCGLVVLVGRWVLQIVGWW